MTWTFPKLSPTVTLEDKVDHVIKAQYIRILDVFVVGPAMVYGGFKLRKSDKYVAATLAIAGLMTIAYNGQNYVRNRDKLSSL